MHPFSYRLPPSHFVKNELPRIRWENPTLAIEVQKVRMMPKEWRPEMEVELGASLFVFISSACMRVRVSLS